MFTGKDFQIRLSEKQESQAFERCKEFIQECVESGSISPNETEEYTRSLLESFRVSTYHAACLSKIYQMLKKAYGKEAEITKFVLKMDRSGTVELAQKITTAMIQVQQLLGRGTTTEEIKKQLNPFNSEYLKETLRLSEQKRQEEVRLRQGADAQAEFYKKQIETLQAQLLAQQRSVSSVAISTNPVEALISSEGVEGAFLNHSESQQPKDSSRDVDQENLSEETTRSQKRLKLF